MRAKVNWATPLGAMVWIGAIWGSVLLAPAPAIAQKLPTVASATSASEGSSKLLNVTRPGDQDITSIDAQRGALDRFLDSHPEIGNEVVGDPAALGSPNFLRAHPELQAFLESHPLVKADPRAFISPRGWRNEPPRSDLAEFMGDLAPLTVFVCVLLAILWVIRTVLENRRWNRSFKMHEEIHTKLIEKFASGEDFNTYMQSEGGRRLLEWAPPTSGSTSRSLRNPIARIFWSLQAGLVLLLMGMGVLLLRSHMGANDEPPVLVFGTLGVTLGAGFILSALVSYGLSRHLGLIDGTAQGTGATEK